jgi:hypothetical protein
MELLVRIAVAGAMTAALLIAFNANAQDQDKLKINCASADRGTILDAFVQFDSSRPRLVNLILKNNNSVHRPNLERKSVNEFYYGPTLVHIKVQLANGKLMTFGAQPSISEPGSWSGTLEIDSKPTMLSCDIL